MLSNANQMVLLRACYPCWRPVVRHILRQVRYLRDGATLCLPQQSARHPYGLYRWVLADAGRSFVRMWPLTAISF
jgi:hypothetical protein